MLSPLEGAETSREDAVIFSDGLTCQDMQPVGRVLLHKSRNLTDAPGVVLRLYTLRASPALVVDPFVSVLLATPLSNTCAPAAYVRQRRSHARPRNLLKRRLQRQVACPIREPGAGDAVCPGCPWTPSTFLLSVNRTPFALFSRSGLLLLRRKAGDSELRRGLDLRR